MTTSTPLADALHERVHALSPSHVEVINESRQHAGYFDGKESHFKLVLVSDAFIGKRLVQRHQLVYGLVNDLLAQGGGTIHALALHTYTPDEWHTQTHAPASPQCAGQRR